LHFTILSDKMQQDMFVIKPSSKLSPAHLISLKASASSNKSILMVMRKRWRKLRMLLVLIQMLTRLFWRKLLRSVLKLLPWMKSLSKVKQVLNHFNYKSQFQKISLCSVIHQEQLETPKVSSYPIRWLCSVLSQLIQDLVLLYSQRPIVTFPIYQLLIHSSRHSWQQLW